MVQLLLDHGASLSVKDTAYGDSALHKACAGGHLDVIRALLDGGADRNAMTNSAELPWEVATFYKQQPAVELLCSYASQMRFPASAPR